MPHAKTMGGSGLAWGSDPNPEAAARLPRSLSAAILLKRSSAGRELDFATSSTLSATVGRSPRPRFATLVRVRQEVSKRIDSARGAATSVDGGELRELLTPAAAAALANADCLRPWFARRADTRFPRRHLLERDPDTLPDLERVVDSPMRPREANGASSANG